MTPDEYEQAAAERSKRSDVVGIVVGSLVCAAVFLVMVLFQVWVDGAYVEWLMQP